MTKNTDYPTPIFGVDSEIKNTLTMSDLTKEVGNYLKKLRIGKKITQLELCEQADIDLSELIEIEQGLSYNFESIVIFLKISKILNDNS